MTRRKKLPKKQNANVRVARRSRRSEVLSGKAREDMREKKKALRPKAESGNAVAVPR